MLGQRRSIEFLDAVLGDLRAIHAAIVYTSKGYPVKESLEVLQVVLLECARLQSSRDLFPSEEAAEVFLATAGKCITEIQSASESLRELFGEAKNVRERMNARLVGRHPVLGTLKSKAPWTSFLGYRPLFGPSLTSLQLRPGLETAEVLQVIPAAGRLLLDVEEETASDILYHLRLVCDE